MTVFTLSKLQAMFRTIPDCQNSWGSNPALRTFATIPAFNVLRRSSRFLLLLALTNTRLVGITCLLKLHVVNRSVLSVPPAATQPAIYARLMASEVGRLPN